MAQEMMMEDPRMMMAPEDAGRGGDTVLAHMSLGEVVIPRVFMDDPDFAQFMQQVFDSQGLDIAEFTVGDPANKINPETGYPEFGFFKKLWKNVKQFTPVLNLGNWNKFRDSVVTNAILAGNYLLPGSAALTSRLAGKGVQANLDTPLGKIAGIGTGLAGGGFGAQTTGIPSASSIGAGWTNAGNALGSLGGYSSLGTDISSGISGIGDSIGNALGFGGGEGGVGNASSFFGTPQENALISSAQRSLGPSGGSTGLAGLVGGSSGGGSSFGGSLASALGGLYEDATIKKQKKQLMGANQQQLANLDSFDPSGITSDPGYQFNLEQGQKALNSGLAAQGGLFSGKALKAASRYNQDYANNAFKDYYSRWLNKTGAQNQLYGTGGDIQANALGAKSQNLSQSLSNLFGSKVGPYGGADYNLLKQLGLV